MRRLPVQNSSRLLALKLPLSTTRDLKRQNYKLDWMTWPIDERRGYWLTIPNKFGL